MSTKQKTMQGRPSWQDLPQAKKPPGQPAASYEDGLHGAVHDQRAGVMANDAASANEQCQPDRYGAVQSESAK